MCCIQKTLETTWRKQLVESLRCQIPEQVCLIIVPYPSWSCHASPSSRSLHSFTVQTPSPGFVSSADHSTLSTLLAAVWSPRRGFSKVHSNRFSSSFTSFALGKEVLGFSCVSLPHRELGHRLCSWKHCRIRYYQGC